LSSSDYADLLAANRANWNARALVHAASPYYNIQRYVDDPIAISDVVNWDREVIGDVSGLELLHLQCHIGTDSISWVRLGADVTGLDFSEQSLRTAKDLAARSNSSVRFLCADVCTASDVLSTRFDLVYASVGILCWIPSFDDWARSAAACIRPGGRLYLRDGHAIHDTIDYHRTDGQVVCVGDYFGARAPYRDDKGTTYTEDDVEVEAPLNFQWTHPIGEIVTSLINNGLRIDRFDEMDWLDSKQFSWMVQGSDGRWRFPKGGPRLPLSFSIIASRPRE
jgi:SAM-dependent methyltransferase